MARVVTLDFETYYAKDYSLRNTTTQQYINDPRFQVIGVAASINGGTPQWASDRSGEGTVRSFLESLRLDEPGTLCVAHNAIFDGAVLEWHYGIKVAHYFCTMMGSRPFIAPYTGKMSLDSVSTYLGLGQKGKEVINALGLRLEDFPDEQLEAYSKYCIQDVALTVSAFNVLARQFPPDEVRLLDLTIKKYTRPKIVLDLPVIKEAIKKEEEEKALALFKCGLDDRGPLMSNPQFADLLTDRGVEPPMKISPTTGQETYAFAKSDPAFKALLSHPNESVRTLVDARLRHKSTIEETRLQRFAEVAVCTRGRKLAVPLLYYGAHPGRFSGLDKLNLQNLGRGSALRAALTAPPGYQIVAGDLSQIEARITACLAEQWDLVELFAYYDSIEGSNRDVYCEFGDKVFGRSITKDDERERFVAKTGVLSLGYQSGAKKFLDAMLGFGLADFTLSEAESVVRTYRTSYSKIPYLWKRMEDMKRSIQRGAAFRLGPVVGEHNKIKLPNGMYLHYPDLAANSSGNYRYRFGNEWRDLYGGKLTENVVQALARIVMTTAELRLAAAGARAALSVHDELVFVIPEQAVEKFVPALRKALIAPVPWMPRLPVNCEIGVGNNYAEAK